ncbi:hypothetical protein [Salisaeta longa]|uniref:hypothetical protein n=1 Tax=Salisaeta longa TaxID=503170 RepID=UPI0005905639|nr:hypothetical protein [Salisaeta longa]
MEPEALFQPFSQDFEESIRVDREPAGDSEQDKIGLLKRFYVTASAASYLDDMLARVLGEAQGDRKGSNHWLYGYYGSGKSHLLAVTGCLLDSAWVGKVGRERVWAALSEDADHLDRLKSRWMRCLDNYVLRPLLINLLKEQGREDRGFGSVILRRLYEEQGYSPHLKIAFFERWYLSRNGRNRETLEQDAAQVLKRADVDLGVTSTWDRVKRYPVLADGVMPELFAQETGVREGLTDVIDRNLDAEAVAKQLEQAREAIAQETGRPVRLFLLLDEITLFIGTQYGLLTELNALAEAIDDEGAGRILTVGTAQEDPSRVQTDYTAREVDFSILDDRFPHQYSLPSSHVGDIVQNRLLRKRDAGKKVFDEALRTAALDPVNSLVYRGVKQNTEPRLDHMDSQEVSDYLPLLPYQPPLFLEILARLRAQNTDRAKSIFSGTARAVLAIVKGLLERWAASSEEQEWGKDAGLKRVISLVDFFEVIRPELEDTIKQEVKTIDEVEKQVKQGHLQPIDAMVCKVVLLLQYIPDMIPLDETKNVAVALMDNLDGDTLMNRTNAVEESLTRLGKYIRSDDEHDSYLRFTTQEEQVVLEEAEKREAEFGKAEVARELSARVDVFAEGTDTSLWHQVLKQLDLPARVPYMDGEDTYAVNYTFDVDGHALDVAFADAEGLNVTVHVEGLISDEERSSADHAKAFLWKIRAEGRTALWNDLKRWAALSAACREHYAPPAIEQQLRQESQRLPSRIAARIKNGELKVRSHEPRTVAQGVEQYVRVSYPRSFHPEMLRVDHERLRELKRVRQSAELPSWAQKMEVVCDAQDELRGNIVTTVRGIIGRKLKRIETVSITQALAELRKREEAYSGVEPALVAILWGLCQQGTFQSISEDGEPLNADRLLNPDRWHEIRLRIGHAESFRKQLGPFVGPNDTANDAVVQFRHFLVEQRQKTDTLRKQVGIVAQNAATNPVCDLLEEFGKWLDEMYKALTEWRIETRHQQPQWGEIVSDALQAEQEIKEATAQWDTREPYILQLDALLVLQCQYAHAIGEPVHRALSNLQEQAQAAAAIQWWTKKGWTEYVDTLVSYNEALSTLKTWWRETVQEEHRKQLMDDTADHPWLVNPNAPALAHIGQTFRRQYLDGPRAFRQSMRRTEEILAPMMRDAHGLDTAKVRRALGRLQEGMGPSVPSVEEAEACLHALRTLDAVTAGATPSDVDSIGMWPADRKELTDPLRKLAHKRSFAVEERTHAVIISTSE